MDPMLVVIWIVLLALIVALLVFCFLLFSDWLRALLAGAPISFGRLLGMRLRKTKPRAIVDAYITARKEGVDISLDQLETHALAGGNVGHLVSALWAAARIGIPLSFEDACAIDLGGRDLVEEVRACHTSRTLYCPDPFDPDETLDVVAADGTALQAKAVVSVRPRLILGRGASEGVLVERVAKGIKEAVAAADGQSIVDDPDAIGQTVWQMELDVDTALEIVALEVTIEETREGWRF